MKSLKTNNKGPAHFIHWVIYGKRKMIYELWHSTEESSYMFIPRNDLYEKAIAQNKKIAPDLELIWSYKAKSHFEAMQAYKDHLGYGVYKPEPDWEDTVYE